MKRVEILGDRREAETDAVRGRMQELYEKGEDYFHGEHGVTQDYGEAVKWYLRAAEEGHVGVQQRRSMKQ